MLDVDFIAEALFVLTEHQIVRISSYTRLEISG
jgi:hypothetical protein